ncbi:MAG: cytochrome c [Alphaproteobacteria bacterium]|jgi:mono/diheme cytochrome c family protein|nr:cytochrome c [Alphaproteobacteria bacterium]
MRQMMLGAMLAACATGPALAQTAGVGGDPQKGSELARTWCGGCHVVEARPAAANDQAPGFLAIAQRPGTTADGLRAFLSVPHGRMPNLTLSRQDIDNTVAYLLSLKGR